MAACAIVGAVGLLMEETWGLIFALITGSSLIFLGLMDITFNVQNNLYRHARTSTEMKFEVFLNIWALGFGVALIAGLGPKLALI
jgi:hypothetical protein